MEAEVIWYHEAGRDFLADLRSFAKSTDYSSYSIEIGADISVGKKVVLGEGGSFELATETHPDAFRCPNCEGREFDVFYGEIGEKVALGLGCLLCETYGILFPSGLN